MLCILLSANQLDCTCSSVFNLLSMTNAHNFSKFFKTIHNKHVAVFLPLLRYCYLGGIDMSVLYQTWHQNCCFLSLSLTTLFGMNVCTCFWRRFVLFFSLSMPTSSTHSENKFQKFHCDNFLRNRSTWHLIWPFTKKRAATTSCKNQFVTVLPRGCVCVWVCVCTNMCRHIAEWSLNDCIEK